MSIVFFRTQRKVLQPDDLSNTVKQPLTLVHVSDHSSKNSRWNSFHNVGYNIRNAEKGIGRYLKHGYYAAFLQYSYCKHRRGKMKFSDVVKNILSSTSYPMSPQEIRDQVKRKHPDSYGTPSHHRNVEKGHYKDLDHALLAQIYSLTGTSEIFNCDKSTKPMKISLFDFEKPVLKSSRGSDLEPIQGTCYKRRFGYHDKIREIRFIPLKHTWTHEGPRFSGWTLANNRMHSGSKKRCSFVAALFAAGEAKRWKFWLLDSNYDEHRI